MCGSHWQKVPPGLQRDVYATVRQRDRDSIDHTWAPWWRAQAKAVHHVLALELGEDSPEVAAYLDRELAFAATLEARAG